MFILFISHVYLKISIALLELNENFPKKMNLKNSGSSLRELCENEK